jgi:threonine aldolase
MALASRKSPMAGLSSLTEVATLSRIAREDDLKVDMDGSQIVNALASLLTRLRLLARMGKG